MARAGFRIDGHAGPWIVLSNGIASDMRLWDGVVERLAPHCRILRHDWPGHGESVAAPAQSLRLLADRLLALMAEQGIERAHLAGVSMGAMVSAEAALLRPEAVSGLTWMNAVASASPEYAAFWQDRAALADAQGMGPIVDPTLERWLAPGAPAPVEALAREMILGTRPAGFAAAARALSGLALQSRLSHLAMPVHFVAGAADAAAPVAAMQAACAVVPDGRLTVLEGVAHLSPLQAPDLIGQFF